MKSCSVLFALGVFLFVQPTAQAAGKPETAGQSAGKGSDVTYGNVLPTAAGTERGYAINGKATMVRIANGSTATALVIQGLNPNTDYHIHVHVLPCADGGGGHYKNDTAVADPVEENEIWLDVHSNAVGIGEALTRSTFLARAEAQTIIIHDDDKVRIACGDLK